MDCAPSRFSRRVLTVALMLAGISVLAHAQKPAGASRARAANGDGGPATRAYVHPSSIAADARGNIYVTELQSFVVRKVATDGIITTVAGNGKRGFSGDGGAAISARLDGVFGVAADSAGNIYIAEAEGEGLEGGRIRRVSPDGVIKTIAGGGAGFSGDGGPAVSARFSRLRGIAIDSRGNIYVADLGNNRIRRIDPSGIVSTVAGNGTPGFSGDGGPATNANLNHPIAIAVDARGKLYIADHHNNRIRMVNSGGVITTLAGNGVSGPSGPGVATRIGLMWPGSVAAGNAGEIYIAEQGSAHVLRVGPNGVVSVVAGNGTRGFGGDGGAATSARIRDFTIAVDGRGNLYLAEESNGRIRMVNTSGVIRSIAGHGPIDFGEDQ